ncbi:MAG: DUF6788 family protein [Tepidisphaeraceae bacterium]
MDRRRRCGNPGCHCAKGPGHPALYLILSDGQRKRQRQFYIPKEWHDRVRQWVDSGSVRPSVLHARPPGPCQPIPRPCVVVLPSTQYTLFSLILKAH